LEEKVFGFLMENKDDSQSEHSHDLYLISWDGRQLHIHPFSGITSVDVGHSHMYVGKTEPAPSGVQHTHAYAAETSINDGHLHFIRGRTGPAIPLPNGGHIHFFEGVTTVNGSTPHRHHYSGYTGE
jgi:hypothetical protein